jgi:cell division protein YceG involved in septum cleavage
MSLEAAMAPPPTKWHYFVAHATKDGRSTFSETYGAHASAVRGGGKP